jgi:tRNA-modifying protein YgfZ
MSSGTETIKTKGGFTMMQSYLMDAGARCVLEFSGPDAVRYLNGQVTQDVRLVVRRQACLPACVTDAKGRIQFRVWISPSGTHALRVDAPALCADELEQRLTRYLIADDVEVRNLSEDCCLWHVTGPSERSGVPSSRWNMPGTDLWLPVGDRPDGCEAMTTLRGDALETFRISRMVPEYGHEWERGLFPAELGLEDSDVSFHKGCYIGQEVISRIKSVGKVHKQLVRCAVEPSLAGHPWQLQSEDGSFVGHVTSISPEVVNGLRTFLAIIKKGKVPAWVCAEDRKAPVVGLF